MLKKPSSDLYKSKLKIKAFEKLDAQQHQHNGSSDSGEQQKPLKTFSLKGNQLSGSILIGNYNVRIFRAKK